MDQQKQWRWPERRVVRRLHCGDGHVVDELSCGHYRDARPQDRDGEQLDRALERELMRRWRSLGLLIKAQLTAISEGTVSVDQAMLAHIVDPASDTTVGEWTAPHGRRLQAGRALPQLPAAVRITEER